MMTRHLIVNADDFGRSSGINLGVLDAFEHGIVTSVSLMVRWPAATEAAGWAVTLAELSVGLHLDFGEWAYRDRTWIPVYEVVDSNDAGAIADEISRQLDAFERLLERPPTHIDSHQHVHLREPARTCVLNAARDLHIPVRGLTPWIQYCGRFYGQDKGGRSYPENIDVPGLHRTLFALEPGISELGCHPAAYADPKATYGPERVIELQTLCDSRVRRALDELGIKLTSFREWRAHAASSQC